MILRFSHRAFAIVPMTGPSVKKSDALTAGSQREIVQVADVPEDLRVEFQGFYGKNLPAARLVLDVLEEDDARSFPLESAR
jgi:hypothetical protein